MHWFQIAHLNVKGNDIIIVPFGTRFSMKNKTDREETVRGVQRAAKEAGLKGTVVPVWPVEQGIQFIAPEPWHPFFRSITMPWVEQNLNREILV